LTYQSNTFHIVFDKGTIDAMMCSDEKGHENAREICSECMRVVKCDGCFLVISHMAPSSENGNSFIRECIYPALVKLSSSYRFDIGVHFAESCEESGPFVYAIRKQLRKSTRSKTKKAVQVDIPINIHMY
jgi:hypothetical protein